MSKLPELLAHYKEVYSKYVACRVAIHNYHIDFLKKLSVESYYSLRKNIMKMPRLERDLRFAAGEIYKEHRRVKKLEIEARKNKKPKKNVDIPK